MSARGRQRRARCALSGFLLLVVCCCFILRSLPWACLGYFAALPFASVLSVLIGFFTSNSQIRIWCPRDRMERKRQRRASICYRKKIAQNRKRSRRASLHHNAGYYVAELGFRMFVFYFFRLFLIYMIYSLPFLLFRVLRSF